NVFFLFEDGVLSTPPLGGTILPGITRDSVMALARDQGLSVQERPYAFPDWAVDAASGRLREAFACGTAAVIAAIGEVRHPFGAFKINAGAEGPVTQELRRNLVGIQRGTQPDLHAWVHRLSAD
ncbi:MAG: aminotransferase class IV, partial [Phenylobacterium sp.]